MSSLSSKRAALTGIACSPTARDLPRVRARRLDRRGGIDVRRTARRMLVLTTVVSLITLMAGAGWARADASPLAWSGPVTVDPPNNSNIPEFEMFGVSCPSESLCVALNYHGDVVTSTDPTGGTGAWTPAHIAADGTLASHISCPTVDLCVLVGGDRGAVFTSTDPTGGSAAWISARIDGNQLNSVSCASATLCVAVDSNGNVVTSTNPTGGASAWTVVNVAASQPITDVSCASGTTTCVAVDEAQHVITSTNPTGGAAAWQLSTLPGSQFFNGLVTCPTASLCVIEQGDEIITASNPTCGTAAWTVANLPSGLADIRGLTCQSASLCVMVGDAGAGAGGGDTAVSTNPAGGTAAWSVTKSSSVPATLTGVSCPSTSLCVVTPFRPEVFTTSTPAAGASSFDVAPLEHAIALFGGSCAPGGSLCLAVDSRGNVLHTTDLARGLAFPTITLTSVNVTGTALYGVACPSASLCVAVDYTGNVLTSANPTGDRSAWTKASVDGTVPINAIACPSASLCVAVDDDGNVLTSENPVGGSGAWHVTNVDGATPIGSVACASVSLCVAVDDAGDVIVSTDPTGGAGAWSSARVDGANVLNGIACPTTTLCVAVDDAGNVVASTSPAGGGAAWSIAAVDPGNPLNAVSCSSASQCVAVDGAGNEVNSIDPAAGGAAWTGTQVSISSPNPDGPAGASPLYAVSCPVEQLCVAVDAWGNAFAGAPTPSDLVPPSISGAANVGQTLHEIGGTWTDSPASLAVSWERCDGSGNSCSPIASASGQTYTLTAGDVGSTIRAVETASNGNGDGSPAESGPTQAVAWQQPASTSPPTIAGTPTVGQTLTETHGTWANAPTGYTYQWDDCDSAGSSCSPIAGASIQTYKLAATDVGHTVRVQETASNPGGHGAPASSAATGIVQGVPGTVKVASTTTKGTSATLLIRCTGGPGARCQVRVVLTVTETIKGGKVIAVAASKNGRPKIHRKSVVLGTATTALKAGQSQTIAISLNVAGRRLLAQRQTLKVRVSVSQGPQPVSSSTITFKSKPKKKRSH
jgi:hypothetical protein